MSTWAQLNKDAEQIGHLLCNAWLLRRESRQTPDTKLAVELANDAIKMHALAGYYLIHVFGRG